MRNSPYWKYVVLATKLFLNWCVVALTAFAGAMVAAGDTNSIWFALVATLAGAALLFLVVET